MEANPNKIAVLRRLAYEPALSFSKLHDKSVPSNLFAYYLKSLEEQGLIKKSRGKYSLTKEGTKLVSRLSERGLGVKEQAIIGIIIVVERDRTFLISRRKKEPFLGYCGFPHGRINFGEDILKALERVLFERTGLKGEIELKGLWVVKTIEDGKATQDHHHYIARCSNPRGKLLKETTDFSNGWFTKRNLSKLKRFKDDDYILSIAGGSELRIVEAERRFVDDKEISVRIKGEL